MLDIDVSVANSWSPNLTSFREDDNSLLSSSFWEIHLDNMFDMTSSIWFFAHQIYIIHFYVWSFQTCFFIILSPKLSDRLLSFSGIDIFYLSCICSGIIDWIIWLIYIFICLVNLPINFIFFLHYRHK